MQAADRAHFWSLLTLFDVITDPPEAWRDLAEAILLARSCLEIVRADLTDPERELLARVDGFWLAHPQAFDRMFAGVHASAAVAAGVGGGFWWLSPLGEVRDRGEVDGWVLGCC